MKNSNNLDCACRKASIENDVTSVGEFSISLLDEIARSAGFRVFGKQMERVIELFHIEHALLLTPAMLRVRSDRLQISSCGSGKGK